MWLHRAVVNKLGGESLGVLVLSAQKLIDYIPKIWTVHSSECDGTIGLHVACMVSPVLCKTVQ